MPYCPCLIAVQGENEFEHRTKARRLALAPGRDFLQCRNHSSALDKRVPAHHARLGALSARYHSLYRRLRVGRVCRAYYAAVPLFGRGHAGALRGVRFPCQYQARVQQYSGGRRASKLVVSWAAPCLSARHRVVGAVRKRGRELAVRQTRPGQLNGSTPLLYFRHPLLFLPRRGEPARGAESC